jgi:hypothetical protein
MSCFVNGATFRKESGSLCRLTGPAASLRPCRSGLNRTSKKNPKNDPAHTRASLETRCIALLTRAIVTSRLPEKA